MMVLLRLPHSIGRWRFAPPTVVVMAVGPGSVEGDLDLIRPVLALCRKMPGRAGVVNCFVFWQLCPFRAYHESMTNRRAVLKLASNGQR
jgi:hypothetical protein